MNKSCLKQVKTKKAHSKKTCEDLAVFAQSFCTFSIASVHISKRLEIDVTIL